MAFLRGLLRLTIHQVYQSSSMVNGGGYGDNNDPGDKMMREGLCEGKIGNTRTTSILPGASWLPILVPVW